MKGFFVCVAFAAAAVLSASEPLLRDWTARYQRLCHMFETKNRAGVASLMAANAAWVQVDGTTKNRKELLASMEEMYTADSIKAHEKLLRVRRRGDVVDVSCEVFLKMTVAGKSDARMHSFCVDSWRRIGGRWMMIKTVDSKVEMSGGK